MFVPRSVLPPRVPRPTLQGIKPHPLGAPPSWASSPAARMPAKKQVQEVKGLRLRGKQGGDKKKGAEEGGEEAGDDRGATSAMLTALKVPVKDPGLAKDRAEVLRLYQSLGRFDSQKKALFFRNAP